jgi:hypothetical protein
MLSVQDRPATHRLASASNVAVGVASEVCHAAGGWGLQAQNVVAMDWSETVLASRLYRSDMPAGSSPSRDCWNAQRTECNTNITMTSKTSAVGVG